MTKDKILYLCRQYLNMFGFPLRLYENGEKILYQNTMNFKADVADKCLENTNWSEDEVSYYIYNDLFYYGSVLFPPYRLVVGPVTEISYPEIELKKEGFKLGLSPSEAAVFAVEMKSVSCISLDTLLQSLILFNFTINGSMLNITDIRVNDSEQRDIACEIKETEYEESAADIFDNKIRAYTIDREIAKKIMSGDVQGLIDGATKVPAASSGHLAPNLLRHQKNFFIRLETICARAAIQAGLDADEVMEVEEMYIIKCEHLNNIDRIKNLQYHMILDYADRVAKQIKFGEKGSRMISEVSKYIRHHLSSAIKTTDIAAALGKSRGGLTMEFKKQTGMNLSDFIKLKKIQEAEELLYETDKSLVAISDHLGFSSQSHFCRVFKELKGMTPSEYREKKYF